MIVPPMDPKLETDKVTPELLQYIVDKIVKHIDPDKIILFGSYARGDQKKDSDLDLFIIDSSDEASRAVRRKVDGLLWGREFGVDIIVRKPEEVEWILGAQHPFYVKEIFDEGRLLYEKK